jgi:uncharacterized membrane protein YphA (DoxX/SURF4 family)
MNFEFSIANIGVLFFFIMFIFSGVGKIMNFQKKTKGLSKKTGLPYPMNELGMIGVILLEIIGALIIMSYFWFPQMTQKYIKKEYIKYICLSFIAFMVVVTPLYHPPHKQIIAFLSNVTTTGGFLLIYNMI